MLRHLTSLAFGLALVTTGCDDPAPSSSDAQVAQADDKAAQDKDKAEPQPQPEAERTKPTQAECKAAADHFLEVIVDKYMEIGPLLKGMGEDVEAAEKEARARYLPKRDGYEEICMERGTALQARCVLKARNTNEFKSCKASSKEPTPDPEYKAPGEGRVGSTAPSPGE